MSGVLVDEQALAQLTAELSVTKQQLAEARSALAANESQAWLGNATTRELIEELSARAEIGGYANYCTVDTDDDFALKQQLAEAQETEPEVQSVVEAARAVVDAWLHPQTEPGMKEVIRDLSEALALLEVKP